MLSVPRFRSLPRMLGMKVLVFLLWLFLAQAQEQLTCIACEEGYYLNPEGICQLCPQNSFTAPNVNASSVNNCLCEIGFTNSSSESCQPCPRHSFKSVLSNSSCSLCPQHSVTLDTGNTLVEDCYCDEGFQVNLTTTECEACSAGKYKDHITDLNPAGPITYTLQYESGQYALDGVLSPAPTIYRGVQTIIVWPSSSHPVLVTADNDRTGEPYSGASIDSLALHTIITLPTDYQGSLNYYCQYELLLSGFNSFTIASPASTEAPCRTCPENSYCPTQTIDPIACPTNSVSLSGSHDIYACHCGIGFYAEFASAGDETTLTCQLCPLGTYNNETNQQQCLACPPDTFNPSTGASDVSACQACPANSDSSLGSTAIADCKCRAGFSGDPGNECVACLPGFYRSNMSEYICSSCPTNTYNVLDASTDVAACLSCPANTNSAAGSGVQADCVCNAGFHASATTDSGPWVCTPCAPGTYSTASNSSSCASCPAGTYSEATGASTAETCLQCEDGAYALSAGTVECTLCPYSTWQDTSGNAYTSVECSPCPSNAYHGLNGSVNVDDCICAAGYFKQSHSENEVDNGNARRLLSSHDFLCVLCPGGDQCPGDNANYDCPINYYAEPGSSNCTECGGNSQGIVSLGLVSEEQCQCITGYEGSYNNLCTECPTGTYQDLDYTYDSTDTYLRQLIELKVNADGYESVDAVNVTCLYCAVGTYGDIPGSPICFPCPANASTNAEGADELTDCTCNAGFYGPSGGPCEQCPLDSFCIGGLPEHQACRAHSKSVAGSSSSEDCKCVPGYYSTTAGGTCLKCPAGSYCPGDQDIDACSSNSSSSAGVNAIEQCICDPGQWRGCILLQNGSGNAVDGTGQPCVVDYSQPCTDCGENVICLNNTLLHCPEHSVAPAGSHDTDACLCVDGFFNQHLL